MYKKNVAPRRNIYGRVNSTSIINKYVQKVIDTNFLDLVDERPNGYFYKNKLLLSPTTLCYQMSKVALSPIPIHILETRKNIGLNLMNHLQIVFNKKIYDTTDIAMSEQDRQILNGFLDWLVDNNIKPLAVEKFVTNGEICGFIDMIVRWNGCICILEIKTRNKKEVRITDIFQTLIYRNLVSPSEIPRKTPSFLVMIDDLGKVDSFTVTGMPREEHSKKFNQFMKTWKSLGVLQNEKIQPIKFE